jgi:dipeptidyl aminopeptidase/acylaminoacyl peptidase
VKKSIIITLFALTCFSINPSAQTTEPPKTDLFIVDIIERDGKVQFGKPINITKRKGYDNQPGFLPDGKSLFYTSRGEDKQTDIYRYDIEKGMTTRATQTAESEYSPTVTPDGKYFSVIRVEADSTQRLWKFPLEGGEPVLVLKNIKPVGYHIWVDQNRVVLYILGTPNLLRLVDTTTEKAETIAANVGRTLHKMPRGQLVSFAYKVSDDEFIIKSLNVKTRKISPIIKMLPGNEYFAWLRSGALVMAQGSKLFKYNQKSDKDWQEVADFSKEGINGITRLAVSPNGDRLAFVANDAP